MSFLRAPHRPAHAPARLCATRRATVATTLLTTLVATGAAILAAILCQGCSLTGLLWAENRSAPELLFARGLCEVREVRGDFMARDPAAAVEVEFSVQRDYQTPVELHGCTAQQPGRLRLLPPTGEPSWFRLPGAEMFQPTSWLFSVFRGSYFASASSRTKMEFAGILAPEKLGAILEAKDVPAEVVWQKGLTKSDVGHVLGESLTSFRKRDWIALLTGKKRFTERDAVPLAIVSAGGNVVPPADVEEALAAAAVRVRTAEELAKFTLVGRLDGGFGETLYVRVPLPVLLQGDDLQLARVGQRVFWRRTQVWQAWLSVPGEREREHAAEEVKEVPGAAETASASDGAVAVSRPALGIPLRAGHFVYTHAQEVEGEPVLWTLGRILLTPPAVVLDWVMQHSVFYADFLRWLVDGRAREWAGPIGPEKKK